MAESNKIDTSKESNNDEFIKVKSKSRKRKSQTMDIDNGTSKMKRPHLPEISASSLKVNYKHILKLIF